jgi:hypothetical protein
MRYLRLPKAALAASGTCVTISALRRDARVHLVIVRPSASKRKPSFTRAYRISATANSGTSALIRSTPRFKNAQAIRESRRFRFPKALDILPSKEMGWN